MYLLIEVFEIFESHSGSRMMLRMLPAALNHSHLACATVALPQGKHNYYEKRNANQCTSI
jgi:hypothetical protein